MYHRRPHVYAHTVWLEECSRLHDDQFGVIQRLDTQEDTSEPGSSKGVMMKWCVALPNVPPTFPKVLSLLCGFIRKRQLARQDRFSMVSRLAKQLMCSLVHT